MTRGRAIQMWPTLACLLVAIWVLAPIGWICLAGIQLERDILAIPPHWWPSRVTLATYEYVFTGKIPPSMASTASSGSRISEEVLRLSRALANSFVVASAVTLGNLMIATPASYVLSRMRFRGSTWFQSLIIASRLIPISAVAIPYYIIVSKINMLDTYGALILIHLALTLPVVTWFLSAYFRDLPRHLEEAAAIDGCTRAHALLRVLVPIALPGLTASAALAFMASYSEFFFALLLTQTIKSQTAPVILAAVANNQDVSLVLIAVSTVITISPIGLIAVAFRNYIIRGYAISVER
jgi:multiple sugar transport system permease protein